MTGSYSIVTTVSFFKQMLLTNDNFIATIQLKPNQQEIAIYFAQGGNISCKAIQQ
jgi:hypothetical protein